MGAAYSGVQLLSKIGDPVSEPWAAAVDTTARDEERAGAVVCEELGRLEGLRDDLLSGRIEVF